MWAACASPTKGSHGLHFLASPDGGGWGELASRPTHRTTDGSQVLTGCWVETVLYFSIDHFITWRLSSLSEKGPHNGSHHFPQETAFYHFYCILLLRSKSLSPGHTWWGWRWGEFIQGYEYQETDAILEAARHWNDAHFFPSEC